MKNKELMYSAFCDAQEAIESATELRDQLEALYGEDYPLTQKVDEIVENLDSINRIHSAIGGFGMVDRDMFCEWISDEKEWGSAETAPTGLRPKTGASTGADSRKAIAKCRPITDVTNGNRTTKNDNGYGNNTYNHLLHGGTAHGHADTARNLLDKGQLQAEAVCGDAGNERAYSESGQAIRKARGVYVSPEPHQQTLWCGAGRGRDKGTPGGREGATGKRHGREGKETPGTGRRAYGGCKKTY